MFDFKFGQGFGFPERDYTTLIVMPVKPVMFEWTRRPDPATSTASAVDSGKQIPISGEDRQVVDRIEE
jgi:hypothetical protein